MACSDKRIKGPLTKCGCKGKHSECTHGTYINNNAASLCKYYRNLQGLVDHCENKPEY